MLKPIFHLCDLFSSSISSGICYICKNDYGSCNVKVIFFKEFVFWGVFLACHPPRQCYSPSYSCLNTLLYCNVAFKPVIELLFYLKKLRGFVEWLVGKECGWSVDQNEQLFQLAACMHEAETVEFDRLQLDIWFTRR